ncbi:type VII secretion integral membrane protein EccD [Micromonospora sp. CPCC 206061]|uniref:type VII secretion integral membrane protein EccD n=1 Tax=Micromonospora sp. CPCC 206061 TaxID=3122410 RepID=UPI002FF33B92
MTGGLARVTISTPRRKLDVALPAHVPLAELLPEVLRHAGDGLADDGERHGGWVLRRADGAALAVGQALHPQGVRDGALLFLVPARLRWTEVRYDDVVEAIADGARQRGASWSPAANRVSGLALAALPVAAGLFAVARTGSGVLAAVAASVLLATAAVASRVHRDRPAAAVLAAYAMPYAFAAGAAITSDAGVDGGAGVGGGGVLEHLADLLGGAGGLVGGSVGLLLAALTAAVVVAAELRVCAAAALVGACGALAGLTASALPPDDIAAVLLTVLVCGVGLLPLATIRLARLPLPPLALPPAPAAASWPEAPTTWASPDSGWPSAGPGPATAGSGWPPDAQGRPGSDAGRPDGTRVEDGRVFAAVARAEELLTGALVGYALLATGAAFVLVVSGGPAAWLLVAVSGVALLLRARLFAAVRQRVPMAAGGLVGLAALAAALLLATDRSVLEVIAIGGAIAAAASVTAGRTYARRPPTPYVGRAADLLDTATVVAVVPITFAVLGLYEMARALVT